MSKVYILRWYVRHLLYTCCIIMKNRHQIRVPYPRVSLIKFITGVLLYSDIWDVIFSNPEL